MLDSGIPEAKSSFPKRSNNSPLLSHSVGISVCGPTTIAYSDIE